VRRYSVIAILIGFWLFFTGVWRWAGWERLAIRQPEGQVNALRLMGRLMARVLWQQSEIFRDTGRWWLVLPLLRVTTFLDPTFAEAYDYAGWHIAYNLRAEEKDEQRRYQWVKLGIQVYERGLRYSPNDFALLFGLGWTAYDKLGDTALAAYYLEQALNAPGKFTKDVDWVRHMLAHAYERMPNIQMALKHWEEAALATPYNPVARGASITLRERYAAAETLYRNGYYDEASELMENLMRQPDKKYATIPRHILAQIYYDRGDIESAIAIMQQMTEWHKLEPRAEFKARTWGERLKERQLRPAE
jgi:tetratricopeptide (TPR) repeat protein